MKALLSAGMEFEMTAMILFSSITLGLALLLVILGIARWKTGPHLVGRVSDSYSKLFRNRFASFLRLPAFWVLAAKSWMQMPAGFRIVEGRAELKNHMAAFNPSRFPRFLHTTAAAWTRGSFLLVGIPGYRFLGIRPTDVARGSRELGTPVAFVSGRLAYA